MNVHETLSLSAMHLNYQQVRSLRGAMAGAPNIRVCALEGIVSELKRVAQANLSFSFSWYADRHQN